MANETMGKLEEAIRRKAQNEEAVKFETDYDNFFRGAYWEMSNEEQRQMGTIKAKVKQKRLSDAGDKAVLEFIGTYRNLVVQFPDIVEQVAEEARSEQS